jgi:hypothetical protein
MLKETFKSISMILVMIMITLIMTGIPIRADDETLECNEDFTECVIGCGTCSGTPFTTINPINIIGNFVRNKFCRLQMLTFEAIRAGCRNKDELVDKLNEVQEGFGNVIDAIIKKKSRGTVNKICMLTNVVSAKDQYSRCTRTFGGGHSCIASDSVQGLKLSTHEDSTDCYEVKNDLGQLIVTGDHKLKCDKRICYAKDGDYANNGLIHSTKKVECPKMSSFLTLYGISNPNGIEVFDTSKNTYDPREIYHLW